jgi:hypothetical protein
MSMAASLAAALLSGSIEYCVCGQPTTSRSVGIVRRVVVGAGTEASGAVERVSFGDNCDDEDVGDKEVGDEELHAAAPSATSSKMANRARRLGITSP